jgi:hypothetical protein
MYDRTPRWLVIGLLAVSPYALAQQSPPPPGAAPAAPTRAVPRPDDLEPGVNTSAPVPAATTPSAATPGVSTSGAGTAPGGSASAGAGASGPTDTSSATAPKVGRSSASAKPATSGKSAANSPGPADTPAGSSNSGAKGVKGGKAEDRLQLDTTQITGNQELPKVLYIVPWKRSDLGDLLGKPANSLLDEVLEPVDRDVFKRENRYYDALQEDAAGGADKAAGAAGQGSGDKH